MSTRVPSTAVSGLLHAGVILVILFATNIPYTPPESVRRFMIIPRDAAVWLPQAHRLSTGGGGSGARSETPASLGRIARAATRQFTPPSVEPVNPHPLLAMEPTIIAPTDLVIPNVNLARYGLPDGVPGPASGGRGTGGGIGDGIGTGQGNGKGPGLYDGEGGGVRSRPLTGGVSAPTLTWMIEPEYSEDARKAKVQGTVVLSIEVDARGQVGVVEVRQGLGLGLDERAIEAVRRWKFRPGLRDGKPVTTGAVVHVNFRLL